MRCFNQFNERIRVRVRLCDPSIDARLPPHEGCDVLEAPEYVLEAPELFTTTRIQPVRGGGTSNFSTNMGTPTSERIMYRAAAADNRDDRCTPNTRKQHR